MGCPWRRAWSIMFLSSLIGSVVVMPTVAAFSLSVGWVPVHTMSSMVSSLPNTMSRPPSMSMTAASPA